jgi:serine/threonine protein kinase
MAGQHSSSGDGRSNPLVRRAGELDFLDSFKTMSQQRKNLTRGRRPASTAAPVQAKVDFLGLVSLICDIYQSYEFGLIPMQQFHSSWEREEDAGHNCIVTSRSISSPTPSSTVRGQTTASEGKIIVKRTKKGLLTTHGSSALASLVTELRIRSHPPLRDHPNIVNLKGIAWDFENDDETKPRPLLLEEFAHHRSLETFWAVQNMVRMPFRIKSSLCSDIAQGISALHGCGIVHGDIKPGNILIFSTTSRRQPFRAKLTDFGHSVCNFEARTALPVWTPIWSAPEADPELSEVDNMTFSAMLATDVYSYGLVAASIIVGTSIFSEKFTGFSDAGKVTRLKRDDLMLSRVMDLIVREDKANKDSDFDLVVIESLLQCCLLKEGTKRSISECQTITERYVIMLSRFGESVKQQLSLRHRFKKSLQTTLTSQYFSWRQMFQPRLIEALPGTQPVSSQP